MKAGLWTVCLVGLAASSALGQATTSAPAGGFEVTVPLDVPAGATVAPENVRIAPLPAGKKLAVAVYVDCSYQQAKNALPLAEAFAEGGWRSTFFLAGAPDLAEYAPKLQALGHEVASNLDSGGISAYAHEMFGYGDQEDGKTWYPVPSRVWPYSYGDFKTPLSDDHGEYISTMRDEFRICNRALTGQAIRRHVRQIKSKAQTQEARP
jgi:hypothetical protein